MEYSLYPFQQEAVDRCYEHMFTGRRNPILQSPTGTGKTVSSAGLVDRIVRNHGRVLTLAHSQEILEQTVRTFKRQGFVTDCITADTNTSEFMQSLPIDEDLQVMVAMQQTMWSRASKNHYLGEYSAIVVDECHHIVARTWRGVVDYFPGVPYCGLTATPARGDGRGLGGMFDVIVQAISMPDAIKQGYLVDSPAEHCWSWPVDLSGVRTQAGDYQLGGKGGQARIIGTVKRIGDCIEHWLKLAKGKKTLVFACDVEHSKGIAERFLSHDVPAAHIDGTTPKDERRQIINDLADGKLTVVSNFGCLTEGFDCPSVECIILERATQQFSLYMQMLGRGLRTAPGKEHLTILDHVGAVIHHGLPSQDVKWNLDAEETAAERKTEKKKRKQRKCGQCGMVMHGTTCDFCGWELPLQLVDGRMGRSDYAEGELARLSDRKLAEIEEIHEDPRKGKYLALHNKAERLGKSPGWAYYRFKEEFDQEPKLEWLLPDPRNCDDKAYYQAALKLTRSLNWKDGAAAYRYKEVYEKWPPFEWRTPPEPTWEEEEVPF